MATTIVKPGTYKGYVVLTSQENKAVPKIILSNGTVLTGKYLNTNEGRNQYVFPTSLYGETDLTLDIGGTTQKLKDGKQSYEGSIGSLQPRQKGSIGADGTVVGGLAGAQGVGGFGVAPQDISGEFPNAVTIKPADYKFTDPQKFAAGFGDFNRENLVKNNAFAKDLALDNIDTELKALKSFAPAAAALKREFTAADNTFNQAQRTEQLASTVPDVLKDLDKQAADARIYASGKVPDSIVDKGFELQSRATAADQIAAGGFGPQSSASRSISDLMSAKDRIGLSQYGNSLLASNAEARAALKLAPLEYSNAGQQISVNPTLSGSQLQQANLSTVDNATLINADTALSSTINQNQFVTSNENAINQFNANNLNNFALSLFNYKAGLANAVAAAGQTSINTGLALDQQTEARDEASKQKNKTQKGNTIKDVVGLGGQILGAAFGFSDERLKTDIQDFRAGLTEILKVNTVTYKYNKDILKHAPDNVQVGVLAQEIKEILPGSVSEATVEGKTYLTYDPLPLVYLLVNAVQELASRVTAMESHGKFVQ